MLADFTKFDYLGITQWTKDLFEQEKKSKNSKWKQNSKKAKLNSSHFFYLN